MQKLQYILFVFFLIGAQGVQAEDGVTPLTDTRFGCSVESTDTNTDSYLVRLDHSGNILRYLNFSRKIQRLRSRVQKLRSLRRRSGKIQSIRTLIQEIRQCRRGEYDGSDGPMDSPTACAVFGDQSRMLRIINGAKCTIGDSPVVQLYLYSNSGFEGSCSGTVIADSAVLTAAHCATEDIVSMDIMTGLGTYESSYIWGHPDYVGYDGSNDIAIVRIDDVFPTRQMEILRGNDLVVGETLLIAGYGYIGKQQSNGNVDSLHGGAMTVSNQTSDTEIISFFTYPDVSNTCNGDSGGPAVVLRGEEWVVAGTTSYGESNSCANGDRSGFSNVTDPTNLAFIEQHVPEIF